MVEKRSIEFQEFLSLLVKQPFDASAGLLGGQAQNEPALFEFPELIAGPSVYDLAVLNGYTGTETEFLNSLKGISAYQLAVANGFSGSQTQWLESLKGKSAYQIAVDLGFVGTKQEFIDSLTAKSNYDLAVEEGFVGTIQEYLDSLKGEEGDPGGPGPRGYTNGVALKYLLSTTIAEPGAGNFKFNSFTPAAISMFIVSHTDLGGNNITDWVNSIGNIPNLGSRGIIRLEYLDELGGYAEFMVTGARLPSGSYTRIPVAHVSGTLPTVMQRDFAVLFIPSGVYALPEDGVTHEHIDPDYVEDIRATLEVDSSIQVDNKITQAITEFDDNTVDPKIANAIEEYDGTGTPGDNTVTAAKIAGSDKVAILNKLDADSSLEVDAKIAAVKAELLTISEIVVTTDTNITAIHTLNTIVGNPPTEDITLALAAPADLGEHWTIIVTNISEDYNILLTGVFDSGETTIVLKFKQSMLLQCNGTVIRTLLRGGGGGGELFVPQQYSLVGDGTNVVTLPVQPANKESVLVWRGGAIQELTKWDLNVDQIIFDTPVTAGDPITVYLTQGNIDNVLVNPMYAKHMGDGTVGPFELLRAPAHPNLIDITIRGLGQPRDGTAYSITGNQITFAEPIADDEEWWWEEKHLVPVGVPVGTLEPESVVASHINTLQADLIRAKLGLGGNATRLSPLPTAIADANLAIAPGNYRVNSTAANIPAAWGFTISVEVFDANNIYQLAIQRSDPNIKYNRFMLDGVWSAWVTGVLDRDLPARLKAASVPVANLNTLQGNGMHYGYTDFPTANLPGTGYWNVAHIQGPDANYANQIAYSVTQAGLRYYRDKVNGTWTVWKKFTLNNIIVSATEPPGMVEGDIWIQT